MKRKLFGFSISFVFAIGLLAYSFDFNDLTEKNALLINSADAIAAAPTCSGHVMYCVSMQETVFDQYDENCSSASWATLSFHPLAC